MLEPFSLTHEPSHLHSRRNVSHGMQVGLNGVDAPRILLRLTADRFRPIAEGRVLVAAIWEAASPSPLKFLGFGPDGKRRRHGTAPSANTRCLHSYYEVPSKE